MRKVLVLALVSALVSGCATQMKRRPSPKGASSTSEEDTFSAPPEMKRTERKVALVLGPGGYKTFAHAGVIKALARNNIPVHGIVGVEWGALAAALYAQHGQNHEAEWKMYKLEKVDLGNQGFFGRRKGPQRLDVLKGYMRENLDVKRAEETKIPFFCPRLNLRSGVVQLVGKGTLSELVMSCMGSPPLFRPYGSAAALMAWQEIVSELTRAGYDTIIMVNVLGEGQLIDKDAAAKDDASVVLWYEARRSLWQAKASMTDVIEVQTRGVPIDDFESRRLLMSSGEKAGERAARELADKYDF